MTKRQSLCYGLVIFIFALVNISPYDIAAQTLHNQTLGEIVSQINPTDTPGIAVGTSPKYIAINSFLPGTLYVANSDSNSISVISTENNTKIKDIPVGENPGHIAIDPSANTVYVANSDSNSISVISTENNTKIKDIPVGENPSDLVFYDGMSFGLPTDTLYVANFYASTVSVISTENNTKVKDIPVGENPIAMAIDYNSFTVSVANAGNKTVSLISTLNDTKIKDIPVGEFPLAIAVNADANMTYAANRDSNTISVISTENSTKIKDIPVGGSPMAMAINDYGDMIYVANTNKDTVSVISTENNTWIKDIPVGQGPSAISIHPLSNTIYVANTYPSDSSIDSNTISVISGENNTKIKDIPVGERPIAIAISDDANTIYVANSISNTISLIDGEIDELVARIRFDIKPYNSGGIVCDNSLDSPINQSFYITSGTECVARPNKGFEFINWVENLNNNSTRTIKISTNDNPLDSIMDFFGYKSGDPAATLNVTQFGSFTANFQKLPPPLPAEFTVSLFTIVVTALVGSLLIPAAVGWIKSKNQTSKLNSFHQKMALVYSDGKLDESDTNQLNTLNKNISDSYAAGKITNEQYTNLKNEVSTAYQKIFKKKIESLTDPNIEAVNIIKNDIEESYSDGKITELHYNLLMKKISDMLSK
jgi:YVTN family beta-propeller protein